jgi:DNA-directed RNA polymerase specialized sigma24 family protein
MFGERRNARPRESPGDHDTEHLQSLVRRIAVADGSALAELYAALSSETRGAVAQTLRNSADVDAVVAATFVEVWWLARVRDAANLDVRLWITNIASRRAHERHRRGSAAAHLRPNVPTAGASAHDPFSILHDETTASLLRSLVSQRSTAPAAIRATDLPLTDTKPGGGFHAPVEHRDGRTAVTKQRPRSKARNDGTGWLPVSHSEAGHRWLRFLPPHRPLRSRPSGQQVVEGSRRRPPSPPRSLGEP